MPEAEARLSSTGRVEAFSDGVMSIAITLLVLDLRVPPTEEVTEAGSLLNALVSHWTSRPRSSSPESASPRDRA